MKAFLSHSSTDKEFVRAVAHELGRQQCVFDESSFACGEEFRASIEAGLAESSVFALFASRAARDSGWVGFEVDEAWYALHGGHLRRAVVYLIDSGISHDDVPAWLRRARIDRHNSPRAVARDIRHHLNNLLLEQQRATFVGRSNDRRALEEALLPYPNQPPRAIFVTGLPQIGRRSLIREAAPSLLDLRKLVELPIRDGDSVNDIAIRFADAVEPHNTPEAFRQIVTEIKGLAPEKAVQRILENVRRMVGLGELPVLLDEGGMLDADGHIRTSTRSIILALSSTDTAYIVLISKRRPHLDHLNVPIISIGPLKTEDVQRLLGLLAQRAALTLSTEHTRVLTAAIAGHPPTAYHAIQLGKRYGLDFVASDDARLVQYRRSALLHHLKTLTLDEGDKEILQILGTYNPLPLRVLMRVARLSVDKASESISRLIDLALLVVTDEGYYQLTDPVVGAVEEVCNVAEDRHHIAMQDALDEYLKEPGLEERRLELNRLRFLAGSLAGDDDSNDTSIRLLSDYIATAERLYNRELYERAVTLCRAAVKHRPQSDKARTILIKGLIKQEQWVEAESEIQDLTHYAPIRDTAFLRGFMERHRNNMQAAIDAYLESRKAGRRDVALRRELAHCYYMLGQLDLADVEIQQVVKLSPNNDFAFDMWAQIACRRGDEPAARAALRQMERVVGRTPYYLRRLSVIEVQFGSPERALAAAEEAASVPNPPLNALAQLVYCLVKAGRLAEAEQELSRLDKQSGSALQDARTAVRCELAIGRRQFAIALELSDRLTSKHTHHFKVIRRDAITGELKTAGLSDARRARLATELALHLKDLEAAPSAPFDLSDLTSR
ncbi:tir protein : Uncharacterized protein OS=Nitrosospira sp. APG3 GN=EBAPG3_6300 PE=4 SV=1: TIR_2 [Gemmataceae bacterium]|nr:tir protein : Uncharacterized protein OS=Nitrosospira sp. APG3 GN=EBAPG3_6300 PE=4 SV=1: TIR_2 [Gemmataceae bacterium]VTU00983.1 tir protein : Uncharacterized protein OS=Nitrosospira sp. APG3 GN=EBAPG3_6300 PE=4 SV=1: TIR_2 [Gemmataceae bacterium]